MQKSQRHTTPPSVLIGEWLFWCILVGILYAQTDAFAEPLNEYRFGADGWVKAVLLGLVIGASGQMILGFIAPNNAAENTEKEGKKAEQKINRLQQIAIFITPLLYLWAMHRIGFFVSTPLFIALYLYVLSVRDWRYILGVTASIYLFIMLVFIRFFYVALPVGAWQAFYDINNTIITLVRLGV